MRSSPQASEGLLGLSEAVQRWENEGGAAEGDRGVPLRLDFEIHPLPPFRLDLCAWALRRRSVNIVDRWDGVSYRRAFSLTEGPVGCTVRAMGGRNDSTLDVTLLGGLLGERVEEDVRTRLESMLGTEIDLSGFYAMASADDAIDLLVERFRGLKPPRFPTIFEGLLNAVACQQLSLEAGLSVLNRLATTYGSAASADQVALHAFPRPQDLAGLEPEVLRRLGFSIRKSATIIEVARAVVEGRLDLEGLEGFEDAEVVARLTSFGGIGRWSAEYVLLRGLGRLHVFPGDDVGARNNLARWLGLDSPLDHAGVQRAVSRWQPYAGMVYFHLLLERLNVGGISVTSASRVLPRPDT